MNILVFSPYYPPHVGGLESHSDEFNKYISCHSVKIFVFTPRLPEDAPATEIVYGNVEIVRFPAFELIHNYPLPKFWQPLFWQQWRSLFQGDYDIVISRTRFFFTSLMAWRYARKRSLPWLHIEHGSDFAQFNGRFKTILARWYDYICGRFVLQRADALAANSRASADFVQRLCRRTDTEVIYRGVETALITQMLPDLNLHKRFPNQPIIAYLGRLIDGKGVADLLQAVSGLRSLAFGVVIIGSGPEMKRLQKLTQEFDLEQRVFFAGEQSHTRALSLLKAADTFVNPSFTEGIPTAVIEAALLGKAIIATDVGGTPEIITGQSDGFLVPPGQLAVLREKIEWLLTHPKERGIMGQKAFETVQDKFDWNKSAEKYMQLFFQMKNKHGRKP